VSHYRGDRSEGFECDRVEVHLLLPTTGPRVLAVTSGMFTFGEDPGINPRFRTSSVLSVRNWNRTLFAAPGHFFWVSGTGDRS